MNSKPQKKFDIAVIGGGASGMMAAITASRLKKSVIVIEKNPELGRKILATGNGRCNLTNKQTAADRYHGGNPGFIAKILAQFDQFETIKFFEDLGLVLKEENLGRIFPRTDEAKTIVSALIYELEKNKVEIILNDQARKIEKLASSEVQKLASSEVQKLASSEVEKFQIILQSGKEIQAQKLIITAGGQSAQHLGTSGDAYYWLKNMGHTITPLYPALSPLEIEESWIKEIQGLKIEANVRTVVNDKVIYEKFGDLLFTHFGLSGPAAMAQAGALGENKNAKISLDLFPQDSIKELDQKILKIFASNGAKQIKNSLAGILPSSLAPIILKNISLDADKKSAEFSKLDRMKLTQYLKNIELTVKSVRTFKEAQVTHGGVNVDEINVDSMESKIVPGLYLAGEVLDVDGDSGGFNLQWAWSSGHLAGKSSAN